MLSKDKVDASGHTIRTQNVNGNMLEIYIALDNGKSTDKDNCNGKDNKKKHSNSKSKETKSNFQMAKMVKALIILSQRTKLPTTIKAILIVKKLKKIKKTKKAAKR